MSEAKRIIYDISVNNSDKINSYEEENKKSELIRNLLEKIKHKRAEDFNIKLSQKEDKFIEV
jgi:hypothetical protein